VHKEVGLILLKILEKLEFSRKILEKLELAERRLSFDIVRFQRPLKV
jgi:hypothetical protein